MISGPVPVFSSVVKRTGYLCTRPSARFPDRSNRHSVANDLPPLRRFCVPQALGRGDGPQWHTRGRSSEVNAPPLLMIVEKINPFFFETNRLFFVRSLPKLPSCFFCFVQVSNLISRNLHYDAMQQYRLVQVF